MKRMTRTSIALAVVMGIGMACAHAQTADTAQAPVAKKKAKAKAKAKSVQEQIDELRVSMQTQIDALKQQLADRDAQLQAMQKAAQAQAPDAAMNADAANAKAAKDAADMKAMKTQVDAANTTAVVAVKIAVENAKQTHAEVESPAAIHYKNVTLTPKGFVAAESVWRERAMDTDIVTAFNATPYMNAGQAHVSEFNGTGRQSQFGLLVQGSVPFGKLSGYVETDFLGVGVNSNNNQGNSYALRLRQAWGQIAKGGFTFTGGQMWSLVTETKHGMGPGGEDAPPVVDPAYHVGFSWARQYGVRATQQVTKSVTLAMSLEESQMLFSELGTSTANAPTNFFFGSAGGSGSDFNPTANYTDNLAPDVIVKAAYDPSFGHFEVGGLARFFRDRYYPGSTAADATNHTETGGGFIFNARVPASKFLDVDVHMLTGEGVGRYGASGLPDVTVKPSGTLEPLRGDQGLLMLIAHPTPKLDILGIAGGEYVQRTFYRNATNGTVGYAPPDAPNGSCNTESGTTNGTGYGPGTGNANCTGATRAVLSGTIGWTYRIYNGSRGKVQYSVVYTYLTREAWAGLGGTAPTAPVAAPKATNNMIYSSFRYYIP